MAKIKSGILSKVQGKVAGVVGATWKGQNYLRELVKPGNPNTPAQQLQRGKMSVAVKASRTFLAPVLTRFVSKFVKNMSAYNWFVKQNIGTAASPSTDIRDLMLSFGTMTPPVVNPADMDNDISDINFRNLVAPAVPAGHTCHFIGGVCMKDASKSGYMVSASLPPGAMAVQAVPCSPEANEEYFVSGFFADVTDFGTASEKVWAISNSSTGVFTAV
jgi:hypothetical protein